MDTVSPGPWSTRVSEKTILREPLKRTIQAGAVSEYPTGAGMLRKARSTKGL